MSAPIRRSAAVGLPVLVHSTMQRLGEIADIIAGGEPLHVLGLVLEGGGLFVSGGIVPFEEVVEIGPAAVLVRRNVVLRARGRSGRRLARLLSKQREPLGTRLLDNSGRDRGTLDDLVFDTSSGRVLGFSVSGGLVRDIVDGQAFLSADDTLAWGDDGVARIVGDLHASVDEALGTETD